MIPLSGMSESTVAVTFTRAGLMRGLLRTQGLSIGIFVYGLAFGLIAEQAKLSTMQAVMMSAIVYSGTAQLAAIGVLAAGASTLLATAWALIATIFIINARYILFSATMRPWLEPLPPHKAYGTLYFLGDGSWLLAMKAYEDGERDAGFVFGSGIGSFAPWLIGTWLGSIAVGFAPQPRMLGLDFFLVAFAAAMMVGMVKGRGDLVVIGVAAVIAPIAAHFGGFGTAVVLAGLAGGLVAYFRYQPEATA